MSQNNIHNHLKQPNMHLSIADLISQRDVIDVLDSTDETIRTFGPRLTGSPACHQAAQYLNRCMQATCDSAHLEQFKVKRESFLAFMPIFAVTYLLALIAIIFTNISIWIAFVLLTFGSIFAITHFVLYLQPFDWLFKTYDGYNVIGTMNPKDTLKQVVIISGHHDSAYTFNFFKKYQKLYAPRIFLGLVFYHGMLIYVFSRIISGIILITPIHLNWMVIIFLIGLVFVGQFYFFKGRMISPGAGDNLVASFMVIKMGEILTRLEQQAIFSLKHTKLILLSTDAEESGLRGARAYVKRHQAEISQIPTYNINLDSIYSAGALSLMSADLNGFVPLSKLLIEECQSIAHSLGYALPAKPIAWGGGGCDSAEFAKVGVESLTILGMQNDYIRDHLVYHTENDTVDKIEPRAVRIILEILLNFIMQKDITERMEDYQVPIQNIEM